MSSYLYFFLRDKENLCPMFTFSRNSDEYSMFSAAPYGKLYPLTMDDIEYYMDDVEQSIKNIESVINMRYEQIDKVSQFNNKAEEKYEIVSELINDISDTKEYLESLKSKRNFILFLKSILNEAYETKYFSDKDKKINHNEYIYYGIDCYVSTMKELKEREDIEI